MTKAIIVFFTFLLSAVQAQTLNSNEGKNQGVITILDTEVTLELNMDKNGDFPCIGIRLDDNIINMQCGTYLEIKKDAGIYFIMYNYELTGFKKISEAVEVFLEDMFMRFYEEEHVKHGKKVWKTFIRNGGIKQFLEISKDFIDEEFLCSPFNETYG